VDFTLSFKLVSFYIYYY